MTINRAAVDKEARGFVDNDVVLIKEEDVELLDILGVERVIQN